jgi:hypothetical protein
MKIPILPVICLAVFWGLGATGALAETSLAEAAVSENHEVSETAIQALRSQGSHGLATLLTAFQDEIGSRRAAMISRTPSGQVETTPPHWERIRNAVDRVAGQHDAWISSLYWHTDIDQAREVARRSGLPILSLRLLGRLDDELSCANSRFFRTTLYSDPVVANLLREKFVLHWQSVRPVPKVTVDFGDGRKIETTVTGNSIHYVLDAEGRVIDALPGLYDAKKFASILEADREFVGALDQVPIHERPAKIAQRQAVWRDDLRVEWAAALAAVGAEPKLPTVENLQAAMTPAILTQIALHQASGLAPEVAALVASKAPVPSAAEAARMAMSKRVVETPILRALRQLRQSIAEDTVHNQYIFRRQILHWLAVSSPAPDVASLNTRVYAELFLTPNQDPWLGLVPDDLYGGIVNAGKKSAE